MRDPLSSLEAQLTDSNLLAQVDEAVFREQLRWTKSSHFRCQSANDFPYPVPAGHEACSKLKLVGPLTEQLESFYARIGTWDVPPASVHEALQLRVAAPLEFGPMPPHSAFLEFSDGSPTMVSTVELSEWLKAESIEQLEWQRTVEAKSTERRVWGCFDTSAFPLNISVGVDGHVRPAEASSLRSTMHADGTMMATCLDTGASAWDTMPEGVVNAVPKDAWEINAAGGFCLRVTASLTHLEEAVAPPDDWLCVICLGEDSNGAVLTTCGHLFHSRCINSWFRCARRCPLCRRTCRTGPGVFQPPMDFELES